jgi:hypothetical protein
MKVEEIHLAFERNIQLTQLSDNAIASLKSFLSGDLQKAYDQKDSVLKSISDYNKKIDSTNAKFKSIESGDYLKAYNDITNKAKELGVAPNTVQGLIELDKTYYRIKDFVSQLTKI